MRIIVSNEIADLRGANRITERLIALYEGPDGDRIQNRDKILADLHTSRSERNARIDWLELHCPSPLQGEPAALITGVFGQVVC